MSRTSFKSHIQAALAAALLLALCQIVVESLVIAVYMRRVLVMPYTGFSTQMYDFCVKLFFLLPGAMEWVRGGALDRFLPSEFFSKLQLSGAVVGPNLLIAGSIAIMIAGIRYARRRPARVATVLWMLATVGALVHLVSFAAAVHMPKAWSVWIIVRNAGRVLVWEGTLVALAVLATATVAANLIVRLPFSRWSAAIGAVSATAVAVLGLLSAGPGLSTRAGKLTEPFDPRPAPMSAENIVLISIDSLRADRLGCYGNPRPTSPALDRLAHGGVRFANAMSTTSWTLPSHMSLLTGRYLLSHGVIAQMDRLPDEVPTLAESLQRAGFDTGGIVSALYLKGYYGFDRGFGHYDDSTPAATWYDELSDETAPVVTDLTINWLRQRRAGRFFLFVHFWDVHYDYIPPAPYDRMFDPDYDGAINGVNFYRNPAVHRGMPQRDVEHLLALYDGEIRWVDDHIGRILATLDELGVASRTAVIVTSDHGDEFFEHGFKGHQRTLYREVVQVPLIMRIPGVTPGVVVEEPVSLVDVMPSVLDLAGVPIPGGVDGSSLLSVIAGSRRATSRDGVYAWLCSPSRRRNCLAMRHSAAGTLIHGFQPPRVEFYGPTDFAQRQDLGSSVPSRDREVALLAGHLNQTWNAPRGLDGGRGTVEIDAAHLERLRALGYLD